MRAHPLWNPFKLPSMDQIRASRVELGAWSPALVEVVAPNPAWPRWYEAAKERICDALGERVLAIEHVGSTAVPGLWAKPMIDIDLTMADSSDEAAWLPDLESAGFVLRVREPEWEEHRVLRGLDPAANLHVISPGAREPQRHLMFRDWLREHPADRDQYAEVKRDVAAEGFTDSMLYNNVKAWFVYDLYEKIFAADPEHEHDPHPRLPDSCAECDFEPAWDPQRLVARCHSFPGIVEDLLVSADPSVVRTRVDQQVWSPLEYAAHVGEALCWYEDRVRRVLREDLPQLSSFDFDAAAEQQEYSRRSIDQAIADVQIACEGLATLAGSVRSSQLATCGLGSDGSPRSVALLLARAEHELVHHELDVRRGLGLAWPQAHVPRAWVH